MPAAPRTGTGRRVPRHSRRTDLLEATRAECAQRVESLFGRPWDAAADAEWNAWLKRTELVERDARKVLGSLRSALRAAERFYAKHPVRYVEECRGVRVKLEAHPGHVLAHAYIDKETLPVGAAECFVDGFFDRAETPVETLEFSSDSFFATGVVAKAAVPGADGQPKFELTYSGELTGLGDSIGFVLQGMKGDVGRFREAMHKDVEVWSKAGPRTNWATRLAVVARWDREYRPGELIGSPGAPGRRLSTGELAAISILCGSKPSLGRQRTIEEWTPARVIDVEAKYVVGVRASLQKMRERVPIPRLLGVTVGT